MLINDVRWKINYHGLYKLEIDDYIYLFPEDLTILQAAFKQDIYLPRFCYHPRLNLVGNCRICMVEEIKSTKPIISCCVNITPDMEIYLDSELAVMSRHNVFEFLLSSHPLDCPICDQGGECDLQDQYMTFGADENRFFRTFKRSVMEKDIGPLVQLSLNRCIQCARCTRFAHDIAGLYTFSLLGRGFYTEISNYIPEIFSYEMSGNIIDLCPVGALTHKIYNFKYRLWELVDQRYLDIFDVLHPYIRIDYVGIDLIRITPAQDAKLDEEWISDSVRFNTDAYYKNRLITPSFRSEYYVVNLSWNYIYLNIKLNFINNVKRIFKLNKNFAHLLSFSDVFSDYLNLNLYIDSFSLLNVFSIYNSTFITRNDFRCSFYLAHTDFSLVNNFILINTNTRLEFPIVNIKIREKLHYEYIDCFLLGFVSNLNFFYVHLGSNPKSLINFLYNPSDDIVENNEELNFVFGNKSFYFNEDIYDLIFLFFIFSFFDFRIFNLTTSTNLIIGLKEIGVSSNILNKKENFNYLSNMSFLVKGTNLNDYNIFNLLNSMVLYFGHHYEEWVENSNFILPTKFFYESSAVHINLLAELNNYIFLYYSYIVPGTKEDYRIFFFLFKYLNINWVFNPNSFLQYLYPRGNYLLNYSLIVDDDSLTLFDHYYLSMNSFFNSILNDFYLSNIVNENSFSMLVSSKKLTVRNDFNYLFNLDFNKWVF